MPGSNKSDAFVRAEHVVISFGCESLQNRRHCFFFFFFHCSSVVNVVAVAMLVSAEVEVDRGTLENMSGSNESDAFVRAGHVVISFGCESLQKRRHCFFFFFYHCSSDVYVVAVAMLVSAEVEVDGGT